MKCQAIIAGIGGQGVLFASRIFTELARSHDLSVLGSQTFGMAQRGGSVMTHIKIGDFDSPLVCEGEADLLLSFDATEAYRNLPYLRSRRGGRGTLCVVNNSPTNPFPDRSVAPLLADMGVTVHACDADAIALAMHRPLAANLVLLGYGASHPDFPFTYEDVRAATEALSGAKHRAVNLEALERGRQL